MFTLRRSPSPTVALVFVLASIVPGVASAAADLQGQGLPEPAASFGLTASEWSSLEDGKVVVRSDRPGDRSGEAQVRAAGFVVVRAPWTAAFAVVGDHERAREYSRCTKAVEIVSRESHDGREFIKSREVHKALWLTMRYTVDFIHDLEAREIRWALDPQAHNDVKDNTGAWLFVPLSGERTLVVYRIAGIPGKLPGFMLDFFVRRDLPRYLSALRQLVEAAAPAAASHPSQP